MGSSVLSVSLTNVGGKNGNQKVSERAHVEFELRLLY